MNDSFINHVFKFHKIINLIFKFIYIFYNINQIFIDKKYIWAFKYSQLKIQLLNYFLKRNTF